MACLLEQCFTVQLLAVENMHSARLLRNRFFFPESDLPCETHGFSTEDSAHLLGSQGQCLKCLNSADKTVFQVQNETTEY